MGPESSRRKTKLLVETLTEEILTAAALRGTKFESPDESNQYSIFGYFGSSSFRCKDLNAPLCNQVFFTIEKCRLIAS